MEQDNDVMSDSKINKPPDLPKSELKTPKKKKGCLWWGMGFILTVAILTCCLFFFILIVALIGSCNQPINTLAQKYGFMEMYDSGNANSKNKIAVISITGIITNADASWGNKLANAQYISAQIKTAAEDDSVKAIILNLNTPGGEVTAADNIYHELMEFKKDTKKPIVASMGSVAASGGVYVAVAADYIIANRLTTTGSIGVIIQSYNYEELFKKIGLKAETYTSGPMKDLLNGARPRNPEEIEIIQTIVDDVYNDFVEIVALGRPKLTVEQIKTTPVGDGRILSGKQALEYGLVDSLGYFDDAVKKAIELSALSSDDYQVITYSKRSGFLDLLTKVEAGNNKIQLELPGNSMKSKIPDSGKIFLLPTMW